MVGALGGSFSRTTCDEMGDMAAGDCGGRSAVCADAQAARHKAVPRTENRLTRSCAYMRVSLGLRKLSGDTLSILFSPCPVFSAVSSITEVRDDCCAPELVGRRKFDRNECQSRSSCTRLRSAPTEPAPQQ